MKAKKIALTKKHFRTWKTLRTLAKELRISRSYITNAFDQIDLMLDEKLVREGKRGPFSKAYKVTR